MDYLEVNYLDRLENLNLYYFACALVFMLRTLVLSYEISEISLLSFEVNVIVDVSGAVAVKDKDD